MSVDREQDSHEAAVVPKKRPLVMPDVANESLTPGVNSGLISLLIYAVVITLLAVLVTYSLTRFIEED